MAKKTGKSTKSNQGVNQIVDEKVKAKALAEAVAQIEKQFGQGALMILGEERNDNVEVISTGILPVDIALGVGGIPRGRIVEIYGPESSGKTTLALSALAEAQKQNGTVAFIDAEHALDTQYASLLGVDLRTLLLAQPDSGEQAIEIADSLIRSGGVDMIVIDSVAALTPKAELDGEMTDAGMGLHARLMSKALRRLTPSVSKSNTAVIFINQVREKIGGYGNPEVTTGGRALKFYSSIRMEVRKGEVLKEKDRIYGTEVRIKVAKNKVAPPFQTCSFQLLFGEGISKLNSLINLAVEYKLIDKSGSWYSYNGERMGQGIEKAKLYLESHPEEIEILDEKVRDYAKEYMLLGKNQVKKIKVQDEENEDDDLSDLLDDELLGLDQLDE